LPQPLNQVLVGCEQLAGGHSSYAAALRQ